MRRFAPRAIRAVKSIKGENNMISKTIVGAVLIAAPLSVLTASAQTWPSKTVRIIVPQPPGGTTDLQARLLAKKYTDTLGQSFVVDNRAGASGMIGTEAVARSPADGYTFLFSSAALSVATTLYGSKFKFDTLKDLAPVICCLLYTSDAADDLRCVDLGGRR